MKKLASLIVLTICFGLAVPAPADTLPTASPTPTATATGAIKGKSLEQACQDNFLPGSPTDIECTARKEQVAQKKYATIMAITWGLVATYCTTACITAKATGFVTPTNCSLASMGAAITDGIARKDFTAVVNTATAKIGSKIFGGGDTASTARPADAKQGTDEDPKDYEARKKKVTTAQNAWDKDPCNKQYDEAASGGKSANMWCRTKKVFKATSGEACMMALAAAKSTYDSNNSIKDRKASIAEIETTWCGEAPDICLGSAAPNVPKPSAAPTLNAPFPSGPTVSIINNGGGTNSGGQIQRSGISDPCSGGSTAAIAACASAHRLPVPGKSTLDAMNKGVQSMGGKGISATSANTNPLGSLAGMANSMASQPGASSDVKALAQGLNQIASGALGEEVAGGKGGGGGGGGNSLGGGTSASLASDSSAQDLAAMMKAALGKEGGEPLDAAAAAAAATPEAPAGEVKAENRTPAHEEQLYDGFLYGADHDLFQAVERRYGESEKRGDLNKFQ